MAHAAPDGAAPLAVTVDASAIDDARSSAGIGRYVRCLVDALPSVDGVAVSVARPRRQPPREAWVVRWANGCEVTDGRKACTQDAKPRKTRDVYVYFDNDAKVRAPFDAMALRQAVDQRMATRRAA